MASTVMATSRLAIFLVLVVLVALNAGRADAANFVVTNNCSFPVWPAAIPVGGGTQLNPGDEWSLLVPAGTSGGRIWARTDCNFVGDHGWCKTGDCAGAMRCTLSGNPPATLAEFTIGNGGPADFYDISVVDGFNVPMEFSCLTGGESPILRCMDPGCADASHRGATKVNTWSGDSNYKVTFCP